MHEHLPRLDPVSVALIIGTIASPALGQILFKFAANDIDVGRPSCFLSPWLVAALVVYAAATLAWLVVLSRVPLSVAFPFYGLLFLVVPILAWIILKERIRAPALIGGVLILAGVVVSSLGSRL